MAGPFQLGVHRLVERGLATARQAVRLKVVRKPGGGFSPGPVRDTGQAGGRFTTHSSPASSNDVHSSLSRASRLFYEHCWVPAFKGVRVQSVPSYGHPVRPDSFSAIKFRLNKGRSSNFRSIRINVKAPSPTFNQWKPSPAHSPGFHHGYTFAWNAPLFPRALAGEVDDEYRHSRRKMRARSCVASPTRLSRVLDSVEEAKMAKWAGRATLVKVEHLRTISGSSLSKSGSSSFGVDEALEKMSGINSDEGSDWSPSAIERQMEQFFAPMQSQTKRSTQESCYLVMPLEPNLGPFLVQENIDEIGLFGPEVMQAIGRIGDAYERHQSRRLDPLQNFLSEFRPLLGETETRYTYLDGPRREFFVVVHFKERCEKNILEAMQDCFSRERFGYYKQFLQAVECPSVEDQASVEDPPSDLDPSVQGFGAGSRQSLDDLGCVESAFSVSSEAGSLQAAADDWYIAAEFLTSSGTSAGERKLMPTIHEELDRRTKLYSLLMPVMNLNVPGLDKGKGLYFLFVKTSAKTPGGLLARPVLTSYYNSEHFKTRPYDPYNVYTSPNEPILCTDSFQSMYSQMVCGLYQQKEVLRLGAVFASGLLRAINFLQNHWKELTHDIATGTLSPKITDASIRECMRKLPYFKPNPTLAEFIAKECSTENWAGIITRIWPNTKYLDVIVTGAMAQYIPTLDFYSGGLPLPCTMYASSECYFGLNLKPLSKPSEVSYTIMPNMAYFEFLPHDPNSTETSKFPRLVDLADVEVGKYYELVITTYAGLCRYQVGDVLLVTGFHNKAPQFQFIRRKNVLLSIDSDKTDEAELQKGIDNASKLLVEFDTSVVEYTSYADAKTIPGHYVIYWELMVKDPAKPPTEDVLNQCSLAIEESLNSVYRQGRNYDIIGPLEIRIVKNGTFEELMDYAISRGASINQYKVPRCVNFTPIMELLDSRVLSTHFSPSCPCYTPNRKH